MREDYVYKREKQNKKEAHILENTSIGIYGTLSNKNKVQQLIDAYGLEPLQTAMSSEIQKGKAYIRSNVSGQLCDYEVEIEKINKSSNDNKGLVLEVTDERLLELTNGIVQGMSGTPIIQDGKIIGAVTHVFVNDSTRGYGIFIENMLNHD